jgi:hypothetical protein
MSDIVLKYVGDGAHMIGVPARDLTAEDLAALPSWPAVVERYQEDGTPVFNPGRQITAGDLVEYGLYESAGAAASSEPVNPAAKPAPGTLVEAPILEAHQE